MKKIPCLFKRDFSNSRIVTNEVTEGCEWVINGEGEAFVKWDGTSCAVIDGKLYKRFDAKLNKQAVKKKKRDSSFMPTLDDFKARPVGAIACQEPDMVTGHWPHWVPVADADKWHKEGFENLRGVDLDDTYELMGPKVNGNPMGLDRHFLITHSSRASSCDYRGLEPIDRTFEGLKSTIEKLPYEGIVFHHEDGRMCKIRRKDFGFDWPIQEHG